MSLYGALFTGVSGLNSQGQKIGIISDNIANVNTVGYKKAEASFETLVVNQFGSSSYSPGGAIATSRYHIDQQGLLSTTSAPTDVAISGKGFFVVNAEPDSSGQALFTRAGSFRQDATGEFKNAAGFYLQGWPLTDEGLKPGDIGNTNTTPSVNIDSLETVNVANSAGVASATKLIEIGANLKASEDIFPGSGATAVMDLFSESNYEIGSHDIIAPNEPSAVVPPPNFALSTPNNLTRGDKFTMTTGVGLIYDYEYGGITIGRQVTTSGVGNIGDNQLNLSPTAFGAGEATVAAGSNTIQITLGAAHGLANGDRVVLSGVTWAGAANIPLSEVNQEQVVTVTGANTFEFSVPTSAGVGTPHTNAGTGTWTDRLFSGRILDANTATQGFFSTSSLSDYTTLSRSFTITSPTAGPSTFTYTAGSPQPAAGQFNSLTNLAESISAKTGLEARVVDGRLLVGAEDASEEITFTNGDAIGSGTLNGVDWIGELGLVDVTQGSRRFSTLAGLEVLINSDSGVSAKVIDTIDGATLKMNVDDPLDTIRITDFLGPVANMALDPITVPLVAGPGPVVVTTTIAHVGHGLSIGDNINLSGLTGVGGLTAGELNATHRVSGIIDANTFTVDIISAAGTVITVGGGATGGIQEANQGSVLGELGIVSSLNGATYVQGDTGILGPEYDSSGITGKNMASGDIQAQFSKTTRIYDALGFAHDIRFSFIKIATNEWAVEVHTTDPTEISTSLIDGQIAVGTIVFNGDGGLRTISPALAADVTVNWTNGSDPSTITLDLGTPQASSSSSSNVALTDGITQFDSEDYKDVFVNQDGAPVGELISVTIDENGFVIASYDNGESKALYQLPIADFSNPNELAAISGNVYAETRASGDVNLRDAGQNGTGKFVANALEQSNVDLASELTDMIIAQRAYQANTRVISTADELLEQLNQV